MQVLKAYRFRLEATKKQAEGFLVYAGCCRFVWNYFLDQRLQYYEATGKGIGWVEQDKQLSPLKKHYPFLEKAPAQSLQQVVRDLDVAYKNFFRGAGYPRFKKKHLHNAFRLPQGFKVLGNRIQLPKVGEVKFRKSREIDGKIKNVTVSLRGRHWFVSMQVECETTLPQTSGEVGLDLGVARFATLSNGTVFEAVDFQKLLQKQKTAQRALSRKERGSQRWLKAKQKLASIWQRIADKRSDYLHKVSTEISKNHATVHVEDLQVRDMTASASGTTEHPGHQVARKARLNKSILEQGWSQFLTLLKYKLEWRGGHLNCVHPQYTSQCCAQCGSIARENRPSQAVFRCTVCHWEDNADHNAAINILNLGRSGRPFLHAEDSSSSLKREPLRIPLGILAL